MRLAGKRVMAIDDDLDTLDVITQVLRMAGAEVIGVPATTYALPATVFLRPDVLLVDVAMPGEDGVSLVRRLRALPPDSGGRIPAATVTAVPPTEAALHEWREAGFQAYVVKPFDPGKLVDVVWELCGVTVERRRPPRA